MSIAADMAKGLAEGGFSGLRGLIAGVREAITGKSVLSGAEVLKLQELANALETSANELEARELEAKAGNIQAEAKGESFLQRNWRPITMLMFAYIVFNNYILAPYAGCFIDNFPTLPLSDDLWDLLKLGIGGYVVGRSAEKIAKSIKVGGKK